MCRTLYVSASLDVVGVDISAEIGDTSAIFIDALIH